MAKNATLPTRRWHPVIKVSSLFYGLAAGLGTAVLLQQYGVYVMTRGFLIRQVLLAVAVAVALPSAAYAVSCHRYNAALAQGLTDAKRRRGAA
jgi:hypothetical protein